METRAILYMVLGLLCQISAQLEKIIEGGPTYSSAAFMGVGAAFVVWSAYRVVMGRKT